MYLIFYLLKGDYSIHRTSGMEGAPSKHEDWKEPGAEVDLSSESLVPHELVV